MSIVRRLLARCEEWLEQLERKRYREALPDPAEIARMAREQYRKGRRAGRVPWYRSRPQRLEVPESLKYYEAIHGTRKTIEMLRRQAKNSDG